MYECANGHRLVVIDGACRPCARERQAEQRRRNAEGRRLAGDLRDRGVPLDADRLADGHRLLTGLDLARSVDIEIDSAT